MELAPIVLFAYKRPLHLQRVLSSLLKNPEAAQTRLIAFSDGPRKPEDQAAVIAVRELLKSTTGFAALEVHEAPKNKGLAQSVITGVSFVLEKFESCIVVEDDLVVSPVFLKYMNRFLNELRDNEKVISIHAYSYPIAHLPEMFFLRGADCWGWATWRRGWRLFEKDGQKLLQSLEQKKLLRSFDFDSSYPYVKMLKEQISGGNDSWAIRWYASAFLADKLTLYPGVSLVENIGMDGSGENCGISEQFSAPLGQGSVSISCPPVIENEQARQMFKQYFNNLKPSFHRRLLRALARKGVFGLLIDRVIK